jgi:hypothetical protein
MKNENVVEKYVEQRLLEWAEWVAKGCGSGIGFSSKNLLAKIAELGGLWIRGTGRHYFPNHPAAEEIEFLVQQLAEQQPGRAKVLRICYLYPEVPEEKAKQSGYSPSQYYFQLKLAHEWFVGYFSAQKHR